MENDIITVEAVGPVRVLTLNRPDQMNAVGADLHHRLSTVWRDVANDPEAAVAVLTGSGRAFCAGGDLQWMHRTQTDPEYRRSVMVEARSIMTEMVRFPLPLVTAVNGPAVGLGCSLLIFSDIVLIADTAHLADPHVTAGLVAGDGGAAAMPSLASLLHVKELLFTGRRVDPEEAVRLGLANRVVPAANLADEAMALALQLASQPPQALRATKRAVNSHLEKALAGTMDAALAAELETMGSTEHVQAVQRLQQR